MTKNTKRMTAGSSPPLNDNYIFQYYDAITRIAAGEKVEGVRAAGQFVHAIFRILTEGIQSGKYVFDAKKAKRAIKFVENFCHHSEGRADLLILELWQKAVTSAIFGIMDPDHPDRYGRETTSPLGVVFTHSAFAPNNVRLIPTQLISSAGNFVIAAILLWYASKPRKRFQTTILWILLYSIGRFFIEFLRNDARGNVGALSTSQFIAIICIPVCLLGFKFLVPALDKNTATESESLADTTPAEANASADTNTEIAHE